MRRTLTRVVVMLSKHSPHPCYCNSMHMCFQWRNYQYGRGNIRRCHLQRHKVCVFLSGTSYTNSWANSRCSCCGKEVILLVTDPPKPSAHRGEKGAVCCVFFPPFVTCTRISRPVMAFPGLCTYRGSDVSKANAGHRNAALVRGTSLANIQSFLVCFVLSLSSSCPVNLQFCLWFPLWLHWASGSLACSRNHRSFLWVNWNHGMELEAQFMSLSL